jgi:acyl-CoA dehydrogenase
MPLSVKWPNGPTKGKNVFIPLDFVIGGKKGIGQGLRMLMECLAAGRAISLPSSNAGIAQLTTRAVGGYARIRQQFKTSISNFEGISSVLGQIAAKTFIVDSTRKLAASAIDCGERPSVISAIAKVHATEKAREVVNSGMDVIGGKGICLGPSNFLAEAHMQTPISITVEGANILTRSLIIFGQGAIRCHPFVLKELQAAQNPNEEEAIEKFDSAVKDHLLMVLRNFQRTFFAGLTCGRFLKTNTKINDECKRFIQNADRFSAAFSLVADYCLLTLGGKLKRKEMISSRLGDILSNLFMISACLKNYKDKGQTTEDLALTIVSCKICLSDIEKAFDNLFINLPNRFMARILRSIVFPWGSEKFQPTDAELFEASKLITESGKPRTDLTAEVYVRKTSNKEILKDEPISCIDAALDATILSEPIEAKIRAAERKGRFINNPSANVRDLALEAFKENVITKEEFEVLRSKNELRDMVIHVDVFDSSLKNIISNVEKPLAKAA